MFNFFSKTSYLSNCRVSKLALLHRVKERKSLSCPTKQVITLFSLKVAWSGESLIDKRCIFSSSDTLEIVTERELRLEGVPLGQGKVSGFLSHFTYIMVMPVLTRMSSLILPIVLRAVVTTCVDCGLAALDIGTFPNSS